MNSLDMVLIRKSETREGEVLTEQNSDFIIKRKASLHFVLLTIRNTLNKKNHKLFFDKKSFSRNFLSTKATFYFVLLFVYAYA
jgi:hypothetical protein